VVHARLYIVCDHLLLRLAIRRLFDQVADIRRVGDGDLTARTASSAIGADANVVLFIANAARTRGFDAQRLYRAMGEVPVVVLPTDDDVEGSLPLLRLGVRTILDRNTDGAQLFVAIRQAVLGEITIPPRLAAMLVADYAAISSGRRGPSHDVILSDREMDVLAELSHGKSNREIAEALCLSVHTVRSHLRSVMQKLRLKNRVQVATYAVNSGIRGSHGHTDSAHNAGAATGG
jgi:DNA-binding NarL/FixJ family response regulator